MSGPFIAKLEHGAALTDEDRTVLRELTRALRLVEARQDLIREGDERGSVHLVAEGLVSRYKDVADGARQITTLLVLGDLCDLHVASGVMDHAVATLTACTIVDIPRATLDEIRAGHPRIAQALWSSTVDEAILREWLVNVGRRSATERVAHLLCELLTWMRAVGLVDGGGYALHLTQVDLSQALGLSAVHLNRVLQRLRADGLIVLESRRLTVLDEERLTALAGFRPDYLHLRRTGGWRIGT